MKKPYSKKALSFSDQLEQLKSRGLVIEDDKRALHYLQQINYYRLSAYMYPFLKDKNNHVFKENSNFQAVLDLYNFDRKLRILLIDALERIEVSIRTNMIYVLSHKYSPNWLEDSSIFYNVEAHNKNIVKLKEEINRSNEKFIEHFYSKYSDNLPPAWISLEVASFGLISLMYSNLKRNKDQKEISNRFGLNHILFTSWLHSLVYIRNICAHHSRLWNRDLRIKPAIPQSLGGLWLKSIGNLKNDRVFFILAVVQYLLNIINPHNHFKNKLHQLIEKFPSIDLAAMGFTKEWEREDLFKV